MAAKLIKFTTQQICKLGTVPLMKNICKQLWDATQTLLRSMLRYPDACNQVCKAITGGNYTEIAKALAVKVEPQAKNHNQSDIVTYVLIGICIFQGAILIGCIWKTSRDNQVRRDRRAKAVASIRGKLSQTNQLPDVVEESLNKHRLIPKKTKTKFSSFKYIKPQLLEENGRGRACECKKTHEIESSHL